MANAVRVVYLANVGTRDVTVGGEYLKAPRQEGEQLLREYEAVRDRLDAPILLPGLRRAIGAAGRIDRLVLFVSDQIEGTPERYRNLDTVYLGQILRRWLPEHPEVGPALGQVVVERIPGNPADYITVLSYYERALPSLVPEDVVTVYVAPVGGTDASNVALWLTAVRHFRACVEMLYVMPDGSVQDLPLARLLLRDAQRYQARALLDHYEYAALARLLRASPEWGSTWLPLLAEALGERLHFNFAAAVARVDEALARARGHARARLVRLREEMAPWLEEVPAPLAADGDAAWERWLARQRAGLAELYWNLHIKAAQAQWVDFLGRMFRLVEGLERYVFERETRHSTEKHGEGFADFLAWVQQQEGVRAFLQEAGMRDPAIPSTLALFHIIRYWVQEEGKGRTLGPVYGLLTRAQQAAQLRNKSIMAHGWQGVGREDVEQVVGMSIAELLETVRQGLAAAGVDVKEANPFDKFNAWMWERLTRE